MIGMGSKRGVVYGVEVGGGLMVAQAALALQSEETLILRADAILDYAGLANARDPVVAPGLRLGGGYAFSGHVGGVFATGVNVGFLLGEGRQCDAWVPVGLVAMDARYVGGEWQLVFAPRIEAHQGICNH